VIREGRRKWTGGRGSFGERGGKRRLHFCFSRDRGEERIQGAEDAKGGKGVVWDATGRERKGRPQLMRFE
jgi:hypothetical protein